MRQGVRHFRSKKQSHRTIGMFENNTKLTQLHLLTASGGYVFFSFGPDRAGQARKRKHILPVTLTESVAIYVNLV